MLGQALQKLLQLGPTPANMAATLALHGFARGKPPPL